ncbi:conserved Plasmodium protein, unknown function [Plasmodium vivax]|uniref:Pinin/SDK/MemA protein domain-containing protein n=1 Tax=Plasmodium vivax TaxID=5855 RepID=A0A1G4HJU3_PLAVI|nr:conserved Plasmodium protein, unknown function [Plasmodium vivax]
MMKSYLSEEDKLKLTIKKNYLERDAIKTKILNYLNRLSYLCSDDKDELNRRERQKWGFFGENLEYFPEFRVEKRPKLEEDETTVTRNRRLLQVGLFEHLKKAKDALEQEKNNETVIRQQMQNKRVEQKLQEEKKNSEKYQLDEIEKKIIAHIKEMKNVDSHIKTDEAKLMKLSLINHYEKMKNFISTNCQPTIFWCPFKFNSRTEMLQKETDNFIKKKIDAIKESNYEVDFEEEPWLRQFRNLKEILRRRNSGGKEGAVERGAKGAVDHAGEAGKEGKEDEKNEEGEEEKKEEENEEDEEAKENDEAKEEDENEEDEEAKENDEDVAGKKSPSGSHYTDEKEKDTQGTPKKSSSNDSDVNTLQKGNACPGGGSKSSDEFYPDSTGDEDLKGREAREANGADGAGESSEANVTNETSEANVTNETNEANVTNETNEANVTNETNEANVTNETNEANVTNETNEANVTNETIEDNDAPGEDADAVEKNAGKKRRGRPKRKGR